MSKLRKTILETAQIIGDNSGCHQIPERSFFYKGKQFPICARCTGVSIGQLFAILINTSFNPPLQLSLIFLGIMGIDWGLQEMNIQESTNTRRLVTGMVGGFGLFNIYCIILKKIVFNKNK